MPDRVIIRPLTKVEEFERLVDIQRTVWKHDDLDVTPIHQFCVSARMGGIILGAWTGGILVGYVYSFPAVLGSTPCQHSHHLAVLPEFQGRGLGKKLKWVQREEAVKLGCKLITWTFDPMQTRNANLNLQALGAVSKTYFPNFYGLTPALCLGPGVPTDRLLIEWPIGDRRVFSRAEGRSGIPVFIKEAIPRALECRPNRPGVPARPSAPKLDLEADVVLAEVPRDIRALKARPDIIVEWQSGLRRVMNHYFGRGYRAEHFIYGDRCFYVLKEAGRKQGKR